MAVKSSIVGTQDLDQASGGNPALRAMLTQLATAANTQATKTNTSGKGAPNQSKATVLFQNPLYIVTITDPGGTPAASLTQAAQQAANASLGANPVQSVIYHQVQAATGILFDAAANLQNYGGDSGSLQTQFVIGNLSTAHSWYFRIRSSFDGVTWNQWSILSKSGTQVNANAVTLEPINGGQFAGIKMLGQQQVGFGIGQVPSGGQLQTASGVLLSNLLGIAAPAGYVDNGYEVWALTNCNINSLGAVSLVYGDSMGGHKWLGTANYLTFGWIAGSPQNIAPQTLADGGVWVIVSVAGGARIAIGQGIAASGAVIAVPPGFTVANSIGVCTPAVSSATTHPAYGMQQSNVVAGLVTCVYQDSTGHSWTSTANWFALAWETPLQSNVVAVSNGTYVKVPTPSGILAFGVGQTQTGSLMPLPPGYSYPKCLAFATPGTFDNILPNAMHGVEACAVDAGTLSSVGTVTCLYGTTSGPRTGAANWFAVAWP